ncbi:MAG: hypothetical protein ACI8ZB_004992 [Desulforhopalus sp.]
MTGKKGGFMKKKEEGERRIFLKHVLAGTATIAGAAAVVSPAKAMSEPTLSHLDETLYHESESFKKYYKTLRS